MNTSYTSVLQFELFVDWSRISNYAWHGQSRRCGLVIKSHLVDGYDHRAARDPDADRELKCPQALYIRDKFVIEFSTHIIVNSYGYGDL